MLRDKEVRKEETRLLIQFKRKSHGEFVKKVPDTKNKKKMKSLPSQEQEDEFLVNSKPHQIIHLPHPHPLYVCT